MCSGFWLIRICLLLSLYITGTHNYRANLVSHTYFHETTCGHTLHGHTDEAHAGEKTPTAWCLRSSSVLARCVMEHKLWPRPFSPVVPKASDALVLTDVAGCTVHNTVHHHHHDRFDISSYEHYSECPRSKPPLSTQRNRVNSASCDSNYSLSHPIVRWEA